jgi:hypothetical protein
VEGQLLVALCRTPVTTGEALSSVPLPPTAEAKSAAPLSPDPPSPPFNESPCLDPVPVETWEESGVACDGDLAGRE